MLGKGFDFANSHSFARGGRKPTKSHIDRISVIIHASVFRFRLLQVLLLGYNSLIYIFAVSLTVRPLCRTNSSEVANFARKIVSSLLFIVESRVIAYLKGLEVRKLILSLIHI